MKYAGIIKNDIAAAPGVCVTFFVQGCPHHCLGCHNPETWDFNDGKEFTQDTLNEIQKAIIANNITRNFCVMGGEPLVEENLFLTNLVISEIRNNFPNIEISVWTGYTTEELKERQTINPLLRDILKNIDRVITGRFVEHLRDITLPMRGSSNQEVIKNNRSLI